MRNPNRNLSFRTRMPPSSPATCAWTWIGSPIRSRSMMCTTCTFLRWSAPGIRTQTATLTCENSDIQALLARYVYADAFAFLARFQTVTRPLGNHKITLRDFCVNRRPVCQSQCRCLPQQFLYFLPLSHGQGALRPTLLLSAGSCRRVFCSTMASKIDRPRLA